MADPSPTFAPTSTPPEGESAHLVVRVGPELYALAGTCVREVTRWRTPTPVPGAPALIPGIISQRGVIIPIVDLRLILSLPATPPERSTRLVIVQHETTDLALLVDAVLDLIPLAATALVPPPAALEPGRARLLTAVARHATQPLGVLNLVALLAVVREGL